MKTWEMIKEMQEGSQENYQLNYPFGLIARKKGVRVYDVTFESKHEVLTFRFMDCGKDSEWTKLTTPVDFITAYNDCKETGQKYKGINSNGIHAEDQRMCRSDRANVILESESELTVINTNCEWVKYE